MSFVRYRSPYRKEYLWRIFLRERIRDALRTLKILTPRADAPAVIEQLKSRFPIAFKLGIFRGSPTIWSSVLGSDADSEVRVRPATDKLERLCLILLGQLTRDESGETIQTKLAPLRGDYIKDGPRVVPRIELRIPPSIDALVVEHRMSFPSVYSKEEDLDSPAVHVQIVRNRREALRNGTRTPGFSRFFYMTWDGALKAQMDLEAQNVEVLVLDGWSMTTSPTYCLLRRGKRKPAGLTTVSESLLGCPDEERETRTMDLLGEALGESTVVGIRRTTALESFKRLYDDLQQQDLVSKKRKLCEVSAMTTLIELMRSAVMPENWMVVGGPSTYWGAQGAEVEVFHATENDARRISDTDQDAHCVLATTRRHMDELDPDGHRAARYLQTIGTSIKAKFNAPLAKERQEFREFLSNSIVQRYREIVDEPLYMRREDVKVFINTGMDLRVSSACKFVPVLQYKPHSADTAKHPRAPFPSQPTAQGRRSLKGIQR